MTNPIAVDLFCGTGGLALGFQSAGFDIALAVDADPDLTKSHKINFPNTKLVLTDVRKLTGSEILQKIGAQHVDVVIGGSPCQGFSLMGKREVKDPRNSLAFHFARLVKELDAKYFVFENVKGLTVGEHKLILDKLIKKFKAYGYEIRLPWRVLNAADFGVPQVRNRLFIIGAKKGFELPPYPEATSNDWVPSWDAISDLCSNEKITNKSSTIKFTASRYTKNLNQTFKNITKKNNKRNLTGLDGTEHTPEVRKRFQATAPGSVEAISRFYRLDPQKPSTTLRAGTGKDKGSFMSARPIHPYQPRCINIREMARIQSFPDWFEFNETKWHAARQIGNSVPPMLSRAVGNMVFAALRSGRKK